MRDTAAMDAAEQWRDRMLDGDFESAWRISDRIRPAVWDGTPLDHRRVLVECHHGLGDTIFFARYFPEIARVAQCVTVAPQRELERLLTHVPGIAIGTSPAEVTVEATELAYVFRTTIHTIPANVPYICLPRGARRGRGLLQAGLVWTAGVYDPLRSVPLAELAPLGAVPGIAWTPLQHGPGFRDTRAHGQPFGFDKAPDPTGADALDTAHQVLDLDLVITPDTMVAHLAGALAIPTWILLPHEADWRWMRGRDDSPWYPTARLFRQCRRGEWARVVGRVCSELRNAAAARGLS